MPRLALLLVVLVIVACVFGVGRVICRRKSVFVAPRRRRCGRRRYSLCCGAVDVAVGRHSYVVMGWISNYDPNVQSTITIGKFCSLNAVTFLLNGDSGHNHNILCSTYQWDGVKRCEGRRSHISIGNDVWIGENVTILGGVTVGDGAIIGTNALVSKDVPPYTIVGGNPAKEIRPRYTPEQIARLLEIRWWDMRRIPSRLLHACRDKDIDEQLAAMEAHKRRVAPKKRREVLTGPVGEDTRGVAVGEAFNVGACSDG